VNLTTDCDDSQTDAADNEQQQYIPSLRFVTSTVVSFLKIGNVIPSLLIGQFFEKIPGHHFPVQWSVF